MHHVEYVNDIVPLPLYVRSSIPLLKRRHLVHDLRLLLDSLVNVGQVGAFRVWLSCVRTHFNSCGSYVNFTCALAEALASSHVMECYPLNSFAVLSHEN